jgi:hypothetical protein
VQTTYQKTPFAIGTYDNIWMSRLNEVGLTKEEHELFDRTIQRCTIIQRSITLVVCYDVAI